MARGFPQLFLNKRILSYICCSPAWGLKSNKEKFCDWQRFVLFHLLEVPRNPVLVPMSTGTTWMMCTCFEINEIFNFFMRKIQSELFRKSTCVTILLFACFGTDKSHSHLSGLKLCLNSDSDSIRKTGGCYCRASRSYEQPLDREQQLAMKLLNRYKTVVFHCKRYFHPVYLMELILWYQQAVAIDCSNLF